jgi:site-specific DNA-methyltransferase (adenine-specific)
MLNIDEIKNTIICGDCLEVMKQLPDKCVDLVLTDPPYGRKITRKDNQFGSSSHLSYRATGEKWDDNKPKMDYFVEIFRISKNQIIFGGNYFNMPLSEKWIVWDKQGGYKFDNPFSACELAWTSFSGVIEKYIYIQQGFVSDTTDERFHPTQKPSELFVSILQDHSKEGDTVLDPFLGSGTTAVACYRTRRNYIGIEISPEYCKIAEKRIQEEKNKLALFNGLENV